MTRFFTSATIALCLGATATLAITNSSVKPGTIAEARLDADGAFRDGLYLGKLAAENGQLLRPTIGRWSRAEDRSMFVAGYRRGYNESRASKNAERATLTQ
jgi:hypothetical protein